VKEYLTVAISLEVLLICILFVNNRLNTVIL